MTLPRFRTHLEACAFAERLSRKERGVRYVIESPPQEGEADPDMRFVVDTDGFTRAWERSVATYENGKKDTDE